MRKIPIVLLTVLLLTGCAGQSAPLTAASDLPQTTTAAFVQEETLPDEAIITEAETAAAQTSAASAVQSLPVGGSLGNTNANLCEGGLAVATEDGVAYLNENGTQLWQQGQMIAQGQRMSQLNYQNGAFYYLDGKQVCRLENGQVQVLYTLEADFFTATLAVEDRLYLACYDEFSGVSGKLYALDFDGTAHLLSDSSNGLFSLYGDRIYYGHPGGSGIFVMNRDGSGDEALLSVNAHVFFVENGILYYTEEYEHINAYHLDSGERDRLYRGTVSAMNVQGDRIVFADSDGLLFELCGGNARMISDSYLSNLQLVSGRIFGQNAQGKTLEITE